MSSAVHSHRMTAATMLWDRAITEPGTVPLDLVAKLARPSSEDWYVFAPALAATKQLALTRRSALDIIVGLARSLSADDRDYAIAALIDLEGVDPALVPVEAAQLLAQDSDPSVAERSNHLLGRLASVSDANRNSTYGRFGL